MFPKQSGYFGRSFRARRGVRQGDILSRMIFNFMVDAVLRHWDATNEGNDETSFYADDGILIGFDHSEVQWTLDFITDSFDTLGLKMNGGKTVFMSTLGRHLDILPSGDWSFFIDGDRVETILEKYVIPWDLLDFSL